MQQQQTDVIQRDIPDETRQRIARTLLLLYKRRTREGSRKLESVMFSAIGQPALSLSRHDLDKWLGGRTQFLGESKARAVELFLNTPQFLAVVPEVETIWSPLAKSLRLGTAMLELNGYSASQMSATTIAPAEGCWKVVQYASGFVPYVLVIFCQLIPAAPFAVAHFVGYSCVLGGEFLSVELALSGFCFSKNGALHLRLWDRITRRDYHFELSPQQPDELTAFLDKDSVDAKPEEILFALHPVRSLQFYKYYFHHGFRVFIRHLRDSDRGLKGGELKNFIDGICWSVVPK